MWIRKQDTDVAIWQCQCGSGAMEVVKEPNKRPRRTTTERKVRITAKCLSCGKTSRVGWPGRTTTPRSKPKRAK